MGKIEWNPIRKVLAHKNTGYNHVNRIQKNYSTWEETRENTNIVIILSINLRNWNSNVHTQSRILAIDTQSHPCNNTTMIWQGNKNPRFFTQVTVGIWLHSVLWSNLEQNVFLQFACKHDSILTKKITEQEQCTPEEVYGPLATGLKMQGGFSNTWGKVVFFFGMILCTDFMFSSKYQDHTFQNLKNAHPLHPLPYPKMWILNTREELNKTHN